ncbi:salivary gland specific protein SAGSIN1 [Spea bombifrons]|uniref:salivary gland specific protein SAGSIN1 n=1 Tax=Spea bombifrons TaxID=233779 RepID=UPI00234B428F|nr:salivary gland specific protein SAGSIN1 [Spea bombifrons]
MASLSQLAAWLSQTAAVRSYGLVSKNLSRSLLVFFRLAYRLGITFPYLYTITSMLLNVRLQVHIEIH